MQKPEEPNYEKYKGDKDKETECFNNLMCAFYGVSYKIVTVKDLIALTKLADYYCALPKVSTTVFGTLAKYKIPKFWESARDLLECAYKLRQPELFRDCLAFMAGNWNRDPDNDIEDSSHPGVMKAIKIVRKDIYAKIVDAHEDVLIWEKRCGAFTQLLSPYQQDYYTLPKYYRTLSEAKYDDVYGKEVTAYNELESLRTLLKNNIVLQTHNMVDVGTCDAARFLCGEIEDEDLPVSPTMFFSHFLEI